MATAAAATCNSGGKQEAIPPPAAAEEKKLKLGTHSGKFHCDEVTGMVLLKYLPRYKDAEIVRSRNLEILNPCDIVIDVGEVFDREKLRFDHHQKGFNEFFDETHRVTKMSSAGLVYKYFGKEILSVAFGITNDEQEDEKEKNEKEMQETDDSRKKSCKNDNFQREYKLDLMHKKLYENFFEMVDAVDNGVSISDTPLKYRSTTDLGNRISRLNPNWNDNYPETAAEMDAWDMEKFKEAMKISKEEFEHQVKWLKDVWYPGRAIVRDAILNRFSSHPSGQILVLARMCPCTEYIIEFEEETTIEPELLYAIWPDTVFKNTEKQTQPGESNNNDHVAPPQSWHIRCCGVKGESFKSRLPLPEAYRGFSNEKLNAIASADGICGLIFVHSTGFVGQAKSLESCIKMAELAMRTAALNAKH